ncbi:hypothetical protein S40285_07372 [Stachybotrys chlorohalonatus IBT 40285]|uniref:Rhodopsin domain-containing protein n=1 Tax=Stachybotrys chlorohalonatus (strain IBT 40285) TaxID=1283841 RepID=A0A084QSA1_STAC4|nr:hypothetical protein S40285_07372 [Stachybotrys chlorohalonata IBT 40285]
MEGFNDLHPEQQQQILQGPAMQPPDDDPPQFDNPPNQNAFGIAIVTLCLVITAFCFLVRAYSRIFILRRIRLEDGASVADFVLKLMFADFRKAVGFLAMAFYVAFVWVGYEMANTPGYFVHQWHVRLVDMSDVSYNLFILANMYTWVQMCSKTAILLEWNHIFVPLSTRNAFFWTTRALIGLTLTFYIALFITTQFYCTPREKIWDRWLPGTCLNRRLVDAPSGVFNAVLDLLIFALPQRVIWSLNMSMSKRLGVSLVFSLGLVTVACAIGRAISNFTLDYLGDVTHHVSSTYLWGLGECTCAMVIFCVHAFPKVFTSSPLLIKVFSSLRSWATSMNSSSTEITSSGNGRGWRTNGGKASLDIPLNAYERMEDGTFGNETGVTSGDTIKRKVLNDPIAFPQPPRRDTGIVLTRDWSTHEAPRFDVKGSAHGVRQL